MGRVGGRRRAQTAEQMSEDSSPLVRSLVRGLSILALFDVEHPEWGLGEICRATGIQKSTAYRLLRSLEWKGFVAYDTRSEKYHFGRAAIPGFYLSMSYVEIARIARPYLEDLGRLTGETIELAIEGQGGAVVVDQVLTPNPFKPNQPIGRVFNDLYNSTMRVIVASKPDRERTRILSSSLTRPTPHSVTDPVDLAKLMEEVAQQGIAWDLEEHELGVCAVSAPILGPDGELRAVITVVSPKERSGPRERREKAEAVRAASARISDLLSREIYPGKQTT